MLLTPLSPASVLVATRLTSHLRTLTQGVHLPSKLGPPSLLPGAANMSEHTPAADNRGLILDGRAADPVGSSVRACDLDMGGCHAKTPVLLLPPLPPLLPPLLPLRVT